METGPSGPAARHSVIWLHGLGADGHDFEPLVPALRLPPETSVRFIFPHAPEQPVTLNGGYVMRAWFDIYTLERLNPVDSEGIATSVAATHALIDREIEGGVASENIVIAGFSQGGVIALHAAMQYPQTLAGVAALSTYLPLAEELSRQQTNANAGAPVFMAHGLYDSVLSIELGRKSHAALRKFHPKVDWREYPMEHAVCPEEVVDLSNWLQSIFK
ncbi:MAG TPA: alpha/beta hydrolase-fold protein [Gammaproteobacteria bacterium]|nr:alpha/beta hydrolase-fold protein [Gammaproteobacteria bacterium]